MKINRFIALAALALLVVGAMAAISLKAFAKGAASPSAQASVQTMDCSQDQANDTEVPDAGSDTDNVDLKCGDQNSPDSQAINNDVDIDTTEIQEGDQNAPDGQELSEADTESTTEADPTPPGTQAITIEQAQTAALAAHSGTVIKTELDDENGQLIYSFEINDGVIVKVDAMTGVVLTTESGED